MKTRRPWNNDRFLELSPLAEQSTCFIFKLELRFGSVSCLILHFLKDDILPSAVGAFLLHYSFLWWMEIGWVSWHSDIVWQRALTTSGSQTRMRAILDNNLWITISYDSHRGGWGWGLWESVSAVYSNYLWFGSIDAQRGGWKSVNSCPPTITEPHEYL